MESVVFTTSDIIGTIKSVSFQGSSYNGAHKVSISVGATSYKSNQSTSSWTTVGTVTGTGSSSGAITITINNGTRALYVKSISVTYTPATVVVDKLLLNDSESYSAMTIDGNNAVSTKSSTLTYEVTYSGTAGTGKVTTSVVDALSAATNGLVVTNDDAGTLTLTGKTNGTYTLTVTTKDKNSSSETVSKNVTVTVQNLLAPVYPAKATSVNGLSIADKIYFVHETSETAAGPLDGSYMTAVDVEFDNEDHLIDAGTALQFVLGRNGNYYTFRYNGNLLGVGASKNQVYLNGTGTTTFNLSFNSDNAVVASSGDASNKLQYNSRFSNYTSAQSAIQMYVLHASDQEVADEFEDKYLVMDSNTSGQCNTYYANAKSTFQTLTDGQKSKLSAEALARLHAWAAAKGDNFSVEDKAFLLNTSVVLEKTNDNQSELIVILVASFIVIASFAGYFVIRRRKENN